MKFVKFDQSVALGFSYDPISSNVNNFIFIISSTFNEMPSRHKKIAQRHGFKPAAVRHPVDRLRDGISRYFVPVNHHRTDDIVFHATPRTPSSP